MHPDQAKPVLMRIEECSIPEPNSGCWLWLGQVNTRGYGKLYVGSRRDKTRRCAVAHRAAYEAAHGPIPKGLVIRHRCDVPLCVNPDHLVSGTRRDNMADMVRRGRSLRGRRMQRKLSDVDVRAIRETDGLQRDIARQYGVSQSAVSQIKRRVRFASVTEV
jgi:hypothetical protein